MKQSTSRNITFLSIYLIVLILFLSEIIGMTRIGEGEGKERGRRGEGEGKEKGTRGEREGNEREGEGKERGRRGEGEGNERGRR